MMKNPDIEKLKRELSITKQVILGEYLEIINYSEDPLQGAEEFIENLDDKNYQEKYWIHLRSYILLTHATLENFIEDCAKYLINLSHTNYTTENIIDMRLSWLMLDAERNKVKGKELKSVVQMLVDSYKKQVNDNHGIKEHNLKKIFEPIAIELSNFNLDAYNELGKMRGHFAHSGSHAAHTEANRLTNISNINNYIKYVEDVTKDVERNIFKILESPNI